MKRRQRGDASDFQCNECHAYFASAQRLKTHKASPTACRRVVPPAVLACECGARWANRGDPLQVAAWKQHIVAREHNDGCFCAFRCPLCAFKISFRHRKDGYVCADCAAAALRLESHDGVRFKPTCCEPFNDQAYTRLTSDPLFARCSLVAPPGSDCRTPAYLERPLLPHTHIQRRSEEPLGPVSVVQADSTRQYFVTHLDRNRNAHMGPLLVSGVHSYVRDHDPVHTSTTLPISGAPAGAPDARLNAERDVLARFQRHAITFCRHSEIWRCIDAHIQKCTQRASVTQFTDLTAGTPMLRERADCYYWLFLSPQAHLARTYEVKSEIPASVIEPLLRDLNERPLEYLAKPPPDLREHFLALTTHDMWHKTPAWRALSPFLGVEPQRNFQIETHEERHKVAQRIIEIQRRVSAHVGGARLTPVFPEQVFPTDDMFLLHPLLSLSGPVRVLSLNQQERPVMAQAESLFYQLMRFVANANALVGNMDKFTSAAYARREPAYAGLARLETKAITGVP